MGAKSLEDPQRRYLSLTGVWISDVEVIQRIQPELEALKRRHFDFDSDETLVFTGKKSSGEKRNSLSCATLSGKRVLTRIFLSN